MNDALVSPFKYHEGMVCNLENINTSCDSNSIERARAKGYITDVDVQIIKALYDFGYLNKNSIMTYINGCSNISTDIKKGDYTRNMKNLVEHGLVLRYNFCYDGKHTPNIYTLSRGAKAYVSRIFGRGFQKKYRCPDVDAKAEPASALRLVAFNQFYIRLLISDITLSKCLYDYYIPHKGRKQLVDAIVRVMPKNELIGALDFVFICVRNTGDWKDMLRNTLNAVETHKSKLKIDIPEYIILVESDLMASEAEAYRQTLLDCKDLNVYYLPDVMAISEKPLSLVYRVLPSDGYSRYDEIKLNL